MRFVVVGAGAVGGVLGGYLALRHHDVVLICREPHAAAIREHGGLRIKSATGDFVAHLDATSDLDGVSFDDSCVLFAVKSYDTRECVEHLGRVASTEVPVASFQNGVGNEDMIAERFGHVIGGVCRMTCSFLQPGQVSLRKQGRVILGRHPKGADPFAKKLGAMFADAGFDAAVSRNIAADKWLKLVVNVQSVWHATIENRDHDTREFVDLKVGTIEEAKRVLKAEKIKARSCDGRDLSIDEMIADLRKPRAGKASHAVRVNNSAWQNLYLKRARLENTYFHQPLIELALKHGIETPYNATALDVIDRCTSERLGPNAFRVADVISWVRERGADI